MLKYTFLRNAECISQHLLEVWSSYRALLGDGHQGYEIAAVANLIYQVFALKSKRRLCFAVGLGILATLCTSQHEEKP